MAYKQQTAAAQEPASDGATPAMGRRIIAPLVLFLLVALVYLPSIDSEFIYDDRVLIVNQQAPSSLGDLVQVFAEPHWAGLDYYRPLSRVTMVIQKGLHGDSPLPYHALNVVIMGIAAVLAYLLFSLPVFAIRRVPAFAAAALFALHPIAAQTVYPITGRETSIAVVWMLAAVYAWLRPGRNWYIASVVCFAAAMFAREQAVVVPLLLILADRLLPSDDGEDHSIARLIQRLVPFAAVFLFYYAARHLVFARSSGPAIGLTDYPAGPLHSFLYTLQVTFAPFVELVYEPRMAVWFSVWRTGLSLICIGVLIFLALRFLTTRTTLPFWLGWFIVALLPSANIFVQETRFAERYAFLSLLGMAALIASLLSAGWSRPALRKWLIAMAVVLVLPVAAISISRARYFQDNDAFNRQWLETDPGSAQIHANLGEVSAEQGKIDQAGIHYREALRLNPDFSSANNNLAEILLIQGQHEEAIALYRKALSTHPESSETRNNLGVALQESGQLEEAEVQFRQALKFNKDDALAHLNLGSTLYLQGDFEEAAKHLRLLLKAMPTHGLGQSVLADAQAARDELARTLLEAQQAGKAVVEQSVAQHIIGNRFAVTNRLDEAAQHYRHAIDLDPANGAAQNSLGAVLQMQEQLDEAVFHYRRALEIEPDQPQFHYNLASLLFAQEAFGPAAEHFRSSLVLNPENAEAHYFLSTALRRIDGDPEEWVRHLQEAVRLSPDWLPALNDAASVLATHANPRLRDVQEAIRLAGHAAELTGFREPVILDTLAAALASAGRFDQAVETTRKALAIQATPDRRQRLADYEQEISPG